MMTTEMMTTRMRRSSVHLLVSHIGANRYSLLVCIFLTCYVLVVGPDIDDEEDAAEDFEPDDDGEDDEQIDDGKFFLFKLFFPIVSAFLLTLSLSCVYRRRRR